ncbi:MAG: DUF4387 domain-containing protein [Chloroflexi bacterium]|nr:DUF4387 domain-containing protein [Chloroflexota bacterium]
MAKISELAMVCRSKNAGPFLVTLDIVFPDRETYERVRKTGVIDRKLFSRLYGVPETAVEFTEYSPGHAFKATIPRLVGSGDIEDTDVYGAQQHAPLLDVEIPV